MITIRRYRELNPELVGAGNLPRQARHRQHLSALTHQHPGRVFADKPVIMRGYHDRPSCFANIGKQTDDPFGTLGIKVARGFVGKDDLGVIDQSTGNGHPLLLASAQLVRHFAAFISQA